MVEFHRSATSGTRNSDEMTGTALCFMAKLNIGDRSKALGLKLQ